MAQSYTEFYVKSSGNNANSGSSDSDTPLVTYTGGSWNSGTGVFDPAGAANPSTDGVAVGMWANIGGTCSMRITAVSSTTFTVLGTTAIGAIPATGTLNAKVGGRWKGPNGTDHWPLNVAITSSSVNASSHPARVNFYNDTAYTVSTAPASIAAHGPVTYQGMTATPGDGGRASFGRSAGAAITLFTMSTGQDVVFRDFIFDSNGTSSTANAINITLTSGDNIQFRNCVIKNMLSTSGTGVVSLNSVGGAYVFHECEFYNNVGTILNNSSTSANITLVNCIFHDNPMGTSCSCVTGKQIVCINSIFDTNTGSSSRVFYTTTADYSWTVINSDFYNNENDALYANVAGGVMNVMNCNFFKNGGWAIRSATTLGIGYAYNCAFGSGTQANTSGNFSGLCEENGSVTYTSNETPWNDPANGDFSLVGAACIDDGRAVFVQTVGYSGSTTAYAHIGAAGAEVGSGGSGGVRFPRTFSGF